MCSVHAKWVCLSHVCSCSRFMRLVDIDTACIVFRSTVYETVLHLSVPYIHCCSGMQWICCCQPHGQVISLGVAVQCVCSRSGRLLIHIYSSTVVSSKCKQCHVSSCLKRLMTDLFNLLLVFHTTDTLCNNRWPLITFIQWMSPKPSVGHCMWKNNSVDNVTTVLRCSGILIGDFHLHICCWILY